MYQKILKTLLSLLIVSNLFAVTTGCSDSGTEDSSNPQASLTLDKETVSFDSNTTATITANAKKADGTNDTITAESSDTTVATVSVNGLIVTVTGVKAGTPTITITSGSGLDDACVATVNASWTTVINDDLNGTVLDTANWSEFFNETTYSLTGSGELKVDGQTSASGTDGAAFKYNSSLSYKYFRYSTKIRITMNDSIVDDAELAIFINWTGNNGYMLTLDSDPDGSGSRNYAMSIAKVEGSAGDVETKLKSQSVTGTKPQIQNGSIIIMEAIYNNGTITFNIKDQSGTLIDSIETTDSTFTTGYASIGGDLNLATLPYAMYYDYFKIEEYK